MDFPQMVLIGLAGFHCYQKGVVKNRFVPANPGV
jgi:hypothetical protein